MSFLRYAYLYCVSSFYTVLQVLYLIYASIFKNVKNTKERLLPPDCLTNTSFKHSYIQLPGIKLHYAEKGDPSKPLLLFVHGFPEFWYSWRYQLEEFSNDYWTVAIDMRGYGDSEKPVGKKNYEMKLLVGDILNLVKALGREKFTIVAHDWGAAVAWRFIMTYPHMLDKYIIINLPHPAVFTKHLQNSWKQFRMSWYIFFFQMPCIPEYTLRFDDMDYFNIILRKGCKNQSHVTDDDIEAFKFTFGKPGAFTPPVNYYRSAFSSTPKKNENLPNKVTMGVSGLLIFGANDFYLDLDMARLTNDYVTDLETEIIPDANHFVQQTAPDSVNKIMRSFLEK